MQGCAMKMKNKKIKKKKRLPITVCNQKAKFDRRLQKLIETDRDETTNTKASYNKDIHTAVITQLNNLQASTGLDAEGAPQCQEWLTNKSFGSDLNDRWLTNSNQVEHVG